MILLCLMTLCASTVTIATNTHKRYYSLNHAEIHFEIFMKTFKKVYANEEEKGIRFEIFKRELKEINRINSDPMYKDAVYGITQFSDMSNEEFLRRYTGLWIDSNEPLPLDNEPLYLNPDAPESLDWRTRNAVTRVKDQGDCQCSWAFSTTGTLEGAFALKHGMLISLSERQLVDCDFTNQGSNGGLPIRAFSFLQQYGGLVAESEYPYEDVRCRHGGPVAETDCPYEDVCCRHGGPVAESDCPYEDVQCRCRPSGKIARAEVVEYNNVDLSDENRLRDILFTYGPMSIAVDASTFKKYRGQIHYCPVGQLNHAVLLVGYGAENGIQYWLIKNSWGTQWGEAGYIRVKAGNNPCGMYGLPGVFAQVA